MQKIKRILMAKPGLDGHDRGIKVVTRALRDAGFEVIYTGLHQTPEGIAQAAIQEDVDGIGLSILSGAHLTLIESLAKDLARQGVSKPIFVGGIIPGEDHPALKALGVRYIFGPGTPLDEIVHQIRSFA